MSQARSVGAGALAAIAICIAIFSAASVPAHAYRLDLKSHREPQAEERRPKRESRGLVCLPGPNGSSPASAGLNSSSPSLANLTMPLLRALFVCCCSVCVWVGATAQDSESTDDTSVLVQRTAESTSWDLRWLRRGDPKGPQVGSDAGAPHAPEASSSEEPAPTAPKALGAENPASPGAGEGSPASPGATPGGATPDRGQIAGLTPNKAPDPEKILKAASGCDPKIPSAYVMEAQVEQLYKDSMVGLEPISEHGSTGTLYDVMIGWAHEADAKTVCETGFNTGASSLAFLCSRPETSVFSFDVATHPYVKVASDFLEKEFGSSRFKLISGNSTQTLAEAVSHKGPAAGAACDLAFVDGGREEGVIHQDVLHLTELATQGALVFVQGCNYAAGDAHSPATKAYREAVDLLPSLKHLKQVFVAPYEVCVAQHGEKPTTAPPPFNPWGKVKSILKRWNVNLA